MSNVAKLKKKAAELEQKRQFDKALAIYIQILDQSDGSLDEADVALYNRVGDLLVRKNEVGKAVDYYEKAVDLYADGGFFNNAIALCNKILRNSPGRSSIYYKLGKISAKKGFVSDAKQNFLEYADRMQKAGQLDEAFRALKEFADLCPDQDDIRLMLAEQLSKKDRKGEALQQLQTLYAKFEGEGRTSEARATVDRMKAIDPAIEPKASTAPRAPKASDLVFLDVSYDEPQQQGRTPAPPARAVAPPDSHRYEDVAPDDDLDADDEADYAEEEESSEAETFAAGDDRTPDEAADDERIEGLEASAAVEPDPWLRRGHELSDLLDFEPTAFGGAELPDERASHDTRTPTPTHDLVLPGELPMLDFTDSDEPHAGAGFDGGRDDASLDFITPFDEPIAPDVPEETGSLLDLEPPIVRDDSAELPAFGAGGVDLGFSHDDSGFLDIDQGAESLSRGSDSEENKGTHAPLEFGDSGDLQPSGFEDAGEAGEAAEPGELDAIGSGGEGGDTIGAAAATDAEPEWDLADSFATDDATDDATAPAANSIEGLRNAVQRGSGDPTLRRRLAEMLLESGQREEGLSELELTMIGFERAGDLDSADSVADEIIHINPNSVRHHQKRVEYAFRTNDKSRLGGAYLELADSLFRSGQQEKARSVYQRVLELAPDDIRAQAALSAFIEAPPDPAPAPAPRKEKKEQSGIFRRYTAQPERPAAQAEPAGPSMTTGDDDDFVNLGDWLRDDDGPRSTRMVVDERPPSGDEEADFADMLRRFKQGVAQNVAEEDHESHYDLGVAYKEMGLLDEAIAEFQKALRGTGHRVRTYEALGQCFLEQSQFQVAHTVLHRALAESGHGDDQLVGVLYLLGYASEGLQRRDEALMHYQRVFAVDIHFRDVDARIAGLQRVAG